MHCVWLIDSAFNCEYTLSAHRTVSTQKVEVKAYVTFHHMIQVESWECWAVQQQSLHVGVVVIRQGRFIQMGSVNGSEVLFVR